MIRAIPIIANQTAAAAFVALVCSFSPAAAMGQDTALSPPSSDYVSRAEYAKLKSEHEAMKQELDGLKAAIQKMTDGGALGPTPGTTIGEVNEVSAPGPS